MQLELVARPTMECIKVHGHHAWLIGEMTLFSCIVSPVQTFISSMGGYLADELLYLET